MKKILFVMSVITNSSLYGFREKILTTPAPFVATSKLIKISPETRSRASSEPMISRLENPQAEPVSSGYDKKKETRSAYDLLNSDTGAYLATVTITGLTALSIWYKYLGQ